MNEELIRRIPLFATLPHIAVHQLADTLHLMTLPAGSLLMLEGEESDAIFFLLDGETEIIKAYGTTDERLLTVGEPGTIYGELSLFTQDSCHTATVRARTPLNLVELNKGQFERLLHQHPEMAVEMLRHTASRLRLTEDTTILDLREKNRQLSESFEELKSAHLQILEKEKLEKELSLARYIQLSILPHDLPKHATVEFSALMQPARAVGGDFYDFIPMKEGKLGIVVGDVSDKGVPAALFMALTYSLIRAESSRSNNPAEILACVNQHMLGMNTSCMYVTVFLGVWDFETHELEYARAGHPMPVILDREGIPVFTPPKIGQAIGIFEQPVLDISRVQVPAGGTVFIFSDGLSEATDAQGREFGEQALEQALFAYKNASPEGLCSHILEEVVQFSSHEQQDDFTLVTMKLKD